MEPIYWLVAVGAFLILEILTLGLTTVWFAGGALVAFIAGACGAPLWLQIVLFLAISIVLLLFTRPVVEKHLNNNRAKTNIDSLVGKTGRVIEEINSFNQTGKVMLSGMEWMATGVSTDDIIAVDVKVEVTEVKGAHLICKRAE